MEASRGDDGVGSANRPEHAGLLKAEARLSRTPGATAIFGFQRLFDTLASLRNEAAKGALSCLTP